MAGHGRTTDERDVGADALNVIKFPRDWFGPVDELIPIEEVGGGADAHEAPDPGVDDPDARDPARPGLARVARLRRARSDRHPPGDPRASERERNGAPVPPTGGVDIAASDGSAAGGQAASVPLSGADAFWGGDPDALMLIAERSPAGDPAEPAERRRSLSPAAPPAHETGGSGRLVEPGRCVALTGRTREICRALLGGRVRTFALGSLLAVVAVAASIGLSRGGMLAGGRAPRVRSHSGASTRRLVAVRGAERHPAPTPRFRAAASASGGAPLGRFTPRSGFQRSRSGPGQDRATFERAQRPSRHLTLTAQRLSRRGGRSSAADAYGRPRREPAPARSTSAQSAPDGAAPDGPSAVGQPSPVTPAADSYAPVSSSSATPAQDGSSVGAPSEGGASEGGASAGGSTEGTSSAGTSSGRAPSAGSPSVSGAQGDVKPAAGGTPDNAASDHVPSPDTGERAVSTATAPTGSGAESPAGGRAGSGGRSRGSRTTPRCTVSPATGGCLP